MAATARDRLTGLCLNDIGPVVERQASSGSATISAACRPPPISRPWPGAWRSVIPAFEGVPAERWRQEGRPPLYVETPGGLALPYDPALRLGYEQAMAADPSISGRSSMLRPACRSP